MSFLSKRKILWLTGVPTGLIVVAVVLSQIDGSPSSLSHKIQVDSIPANVWDVLADLEAVQHYNPKVKSAKYISDDRIGVGAARECDLGKDGIIKERIIGWNQNQYIAMELYESSWPLEFMRWKTNITPTAKGTTITQKLEYKMKFGMLGSIMDNLMMKSMMDKTISDVFVSLKDFVESGNYKQHVTKYN